MSLEQQINDAIKVAMKAKQEAELRALRGIKSAILLAKTEKGGNDDLSSETEIKLLTKLVKQRKDSLSIYEQQGREDLAVKEREEIAVIERYLPQQMSEADIKTALQDLIAQSGATSAKDMGKVMGLANKALAGRADGKLIATLVKELLQ